MNFVNTGSALVFYHQGEQVRIEPWGEDSLRVRATMQTKFSGNDWALTESVKQAPPQITVEEVDHWVGDGSLDKREHPECTARKRWDDYSAIHPCEGRCRR